MRNLAGCGILDVIRNPTFRFKSWCSRILSGDFLSADCKSATLLLIGGRVGGSIPHLRNVPIAQSVEHLTFNERARSSNLLGHKNDPNPLQEEEGDEKL